MNTRLLTTVLLAAAVAAPLPASAAPPGSAVIVDQPDGFADPFTGAGNASDVGAGESASSDGRFVVFTSAADGLTADDDDRVTGIYRKDRLTGAVELVSVSSTGTPANHDSSGPRISDDGSRVAFVSTATNLEDGVADGRTHVYVRDVGAGRTLVVRAPAGKGSHAVDASDPSLSGDGSSVAFVTGEALADKDVNGRPDVYLQRVGGRDITWISSYGSGQGGPHESFEPSVDRLGTTVAFTSLTAFAGSADENNAYDVYRRAVGGGSPELVSWRDSNKVSAPGYSDQPAISPDGSVVAFRSYAQGIDAGVADAASYLDVFVRAGDDILLVSDAAGRGHSGAPDTDGPRVAYSTVSDGVSQVGLRTLATGRYETVSVGADGTPGDDTSRDPSLPADTDLVVFQTEARDIGGGDHSDVIARDVDKDVTEVVSAPAAGPLADDLASVAVAGSEAVTPDGRYAVFSAGHDGLGPQTRSEHVFRRDLHTGKTLRIDRKADGSPADRAWAPAVSADGNRVAFVTRDRLLPADANDRLDVYVHDVTAGATSLVSQTPGGQAGDDDSLDPVLDADGSRVAFVSYASNLSGVADAGGRQDVFVRDLASGSTEFVSRAAAIGDSDSQWPSISADGNRVAFMSSAKNLLPDDGDTMPDVYTRDLDTGDLRLVSVRSDEVKLATASITPSISDDGRRVAFAADGQLDPAADANALRDIYVRDLPDGTTTLASRATGSDGAAADGESNGPAISPDGAAVAFQTEAANLGGPGIAVRHLAEATTTTAGRGELGGLTAGGACVLRTAREHAAIRSSADFERLLLEAVTDACELITTAPVDEPGGTPEPDGGPGPDGGAQDRAPVLSRLSVRRRVARFRLDRPARVTLTVQRRSRGGWKRRARVRREGVTGRNRARLRRLRPGRYRLVARARDTQNRASAPRRVRFRVKVR